LLYILKEVSFIQQVFTRYQRNHQGVRRVRHSKFGSYPYKRYSKVGILLNETQQKAEDILTTDGE